MPDAPEPDEPTTDEPTGDAVDPAAEVEKWKALARKHEREAKQNRDAAKRLAERDDAEKSEAQKAVEAAKAAEDRATKAERELLRRQVAADAGVPASHLRYLHGDDEDDLRANAKQLAEDFAGTQAPQPVGAAQSRRPVERLGGSAGGGAAPDEPPVELDPDKLAAQITAAQ